MNNCDAKPIIDDLVLESLKDALDAAFPEMIEACLADVDANCARMIAARRHSDGAAVKRAAHTLAGVLGQFGCARAACMSLVVADACEADALDAVEAVVEAVQTATAQLAARMTRG